MTDKKNQRQTQMKKSSRKKKQKKKTLSTTYEKEDEEKEGSFLTYAVTETGTDMRIQKSSGEQQKMQIRRRKEKRMNF